MVQVSCQVWVSKPVVAAWLMVASSTECSAVNQSRAWRWSVGCSGVTPGWGGVRVIGSRAGLRSLSAGWAGGGEGWGGGGGGGDRGAWGVEESVGGVGGVEVVVEEAVGGGVALRVGVVGVGEVGGVGAEQVVQGVAAGGVLGDQVRAGEFGQQPARFARGLAGEAGRGGGGDVGAGVQAEQPEQPGRRWGEGGVGPGEHRADLRGGVAGVQRVEAPTGLAQVGEVGGEGGEGE